MITYNIFKTVPWEIIFSIILFDLSTQSINTLRKMLNYFLIIYLMNLRQSDVNQKITVNISVFIL